MNQRKLIISVAGFTALLLVVLYRRQIALFIAGGKLPRKPNPAAGIAAAQNALQTAQNAGQQFNPNRPLKRGTKGIEVEFLQAGLNREAGYNLETDGIFGPLTEAALYDARGVQEITYNQYVRAAPGIDSAIQMGPDINWASPPFFN